jgi:aspartate kinase
VRLIVRGLPPTTAAVARIVGELGAAQVSVDMLVLADRPDGRRQVQLTVQEDAVQDALAICERLCGELGGEAVEVQSGLSRVALVGSGMHETPGVYARAFTALTAAGVEVLAVSASSISIAFLVDTAHEDRTVRLLHETFGLGRAA